MIRRASEGIELYDAAVIGAGPAGSVAARELARAGWRVVLIEREEIGRDRVCGGFLGPEARDLFEAMGLPEALREAGAVAVEELVLSDASTPRLAASVAGGAGQCAAWGVDRVLLDRYLANAAAAAGAEIRARHEVRSVEAEGSGVCLQLSRGGEKSQLHARHLIWATGRRRPASIHDDTFFALKTVYRGLSGMKERVTLHFVEGGHVGFNQMDGDRFAMCLFVRRGRIREAAGDMDRLMEIFGKENPRIAAHLETAVRCGPWQGCPAQPDKELRFSDGMAFYAGDAVAMANPIIGGGMALAMGSALILTRCMLLARDHNRIAEAYAREWKRQYGGRIAFGRLLGWCELHPRVTRGIFAFLNRIPVLVHSLFRMSRPSFRFSLNIPHIHPS